MMDRIDIPAELLDLDDDYAAETAFLTDALRPTPGRWFEVWRPDTTDGDYDVVCWKVDEQGNGYLLTLDPFPVVAAETPLYLAQIGART